MWFRKNEIAYAHANLQINYFFILQVLCMSCIYHSLQQSCFLLILRFFHAKILYIRQNDFCTNTTSRALRSFIHFSFRVSLFLLRKKNSEFSGKNSLHKVFLFEKEDGWDRVGVLILVMSSLPQIYLTFKRYTSRTTFCVQM